MMPRTFTFAPLIPLTSTLLLVGGCAGFTSPVAGDPDEFVDVTTLVGTWQDSENDWPVLELKHADFNTLNGTFYESDYGDGPDELGFTVRLARVGDLTVASATYDMDMGAGWGTDEQIWAVGSIRFEDDDSRMVVSGVNSSAVRADLESGALVGEMLSEEGESGGYGAVLAEVDGETLRHYLVENPDVFDGEEEVVFERYIPSAAGRDRQGSEGSDYPSYVTPEIYLPTATSQVPQSWSHGSSPPPGPASVEGAAITPSGPGIAATLTGRGDEPLPVGRLVATLGIVLLASLLGVFLATYVARRASDRSDVPPEDEMLGDPLLGPADAEIHSGGHSALDTVRRYAGPALLIFAVAIGPILFLTLLLRGLAIPSWVPGIHPGTQTALHDFAPYMLVFSFGALVGIAEVVSSYPRFPSEAIGTLWAALLVLLNAVGTTIVYAVIMTYASGYDHPLIRAFGIAVGFSILIRTRFVLARDLRAAGGEGGVSLNFGWLYSKFQELCRQRIEGDLMKSPRYATQRMLDLYPDTESLVKLAVHAARARDSVDSAELQSWLDVIRAEDLPESIVRARIAGFVVRTAGPSQVGFLIDHSPEQQS